MGTLRWLDRTDPNRWTDACTRLAAAPRRSHDDVLGLVATLQKEGSGFPSLAHVMRALRDERPRFLELLTGKRERRIDLARRLDDGKLDESGRPCARPCRRRRTGDISSGLARRHEP